MPETRLKTANILARWTTLGLVLAAVAVVWTSRPAAPPTEAFLVKQPDSQPWKAITESQIESGATIPSNTNVIFHLPFNFDGIPREVLLGQKGKDVRYWGYCLPQNYDPTIIENRVGLPGLMFLSEKERRERKIKETAKQPVFSLDNLPTLQQVKNIGKQDKGIIRHQLDAFDIGMLCYIMTESPLSIGMDPDHDLLNNKLEREIGTNANVKDSDADGIGDGTEYLTGTSPTLRDTESDGLIDGIEDVNWNGKVDLEETDPRTKDTDRDGLCDGMCRMRLGNGQQIFAGEDKNLDGKVDEGETDPREYSTKGDGSNDFLNFLRCLTGGKTDC